MQHILNESAVFRYNGIHLADCVRNDCSSENITVLGSHKVFDDRVLLQLFLYYAFHFCVRKRRKTLFYIKYSIYTYTADLLIKGFQLFRNCRCDPTH